jgi:signal transduction histidine kinase
MVHRGGLVCVCFAVATGAASVHAAREFPAPVRVTQVEVYEGGGPEFPVGATRSSYGQVATDAEDSQSADAATGADRAREGDAGAWRTIDLPHRWHADRGPGIRTAWYRFHLEIEDPAQIDLAVFLPKVSMNADLWIDGRLVARLGRMSPTLTRHWNTPLLFRVPSLVLAPGSNALLLRVRAEDRHNGGLAPFWVGPARALEPLADRARFWRVTLVTMLISGVLALAAVVVIVWVRRPKRVDYLFFSLGAVGCAIASLNMTVSNPPVPDDVWETIVHMALHGAVVCLALFGWEFAGVSTRRLRAPLAAIVMLDLLALLLLEDVALRLAVSVFSLIVFTTAVVAFVPLVRRLRERPVVDFLVFGFAAVATITVGAYDWLVVSGLLPYTAPFGLPYAWPVLLGAFAWLIAGDYARTQADLSALNAELGARVEARERALLETYERLSAVERERASAEERSRILRDMHDGVGSHLATALRQLESGAAANGDVAATLRDSLDYLKLSIDSMSATPGDVNAMLAALRYRLGARLEAAGLRIVWQVDELPMWPGGRREGAMRSLQFLLFELISNVVQHARAGELRVHARADGDAIELTIADDGRGLPPGAALRGCEARAASIGVGLDVAGGEGGTRVRLRLA